MSKEKKLLIIADSEDWFGFADRMVASVEVATGWLTDIAISSRMAMSSDEIDREEVQRIYSNQHRDRVPWVAKCDVGLAKDWDVILSIHCTEIFSKELVEAVPCYNVHPGFLPIGRGWHPVTWSMLGGWTCGATLHRMDSGVDTGPVVDQRVVPYHASECLYAVLDRVHAAERALVIDNIHKILKGTATETPQSQTHSWPTVTKRDIAKLLNWRIDDMSEGQLKLLKALQAGTYNRHGGGSVILHTGSGRRFRAGLVMEEIDAPGRLESEHDS